MNTAAAPSLRDSSWATALFALALVLIYNDTTLSMLSIWARSDTFAHGFLILPISLWLVWTRRDYLLAVPPAPAPWVAALMLPVVAGWLLAVLVDVLVVQQLALVAMLVIGTWAVLGHRLAWAMAFPLFFLFFMVPMGEGLIAPMMEFTATSTVWLIRATGIPVFREGLFFTLPSGRWSVVEACSGVRYIIASVTVGTLFAYLTYNSWWRRGLFILISAIVPVFANTVRAYIIVMLGHVSDMKIATGADHLVYGWVFFGIVIFILFWLGSFFREDLPPLPVADPEGAATAAGASRAGTIVALICVLAVAAVGPVAAWRAGENLRVAAAPVLPAAQAGWRDHTGNPWAWQPAGMVGGLAQAFYESDAGVVGVVVQYPDGSFGLGEVIGSNRVFTWQDGPWQVVGRDSVRVSAAGSAVAADEALVRGPGGELVAWSWYLLGGLQTSNDYVGKVQQALSSLGMSEAGAWRILLVTPAGRDPAAGRELMQTYLDDHGAALVEGLRATPVAASR